MKSSVTSDAESRSLQVYLPQSIPPMCLIVILALLVVTAVVNFSEGFISVDSYVQMTEGLDAIEVLKGTVKVTSFPGIFLAMMVLEVPTLSSRYLSPAVTSFQSFIHLTSHGLVN